MAKDSFMTTEGDRSGVDTPSKADKARNKLRAAIAVLQHLDQGWDLARVEDRVSTIAEVRHNLKVISDMTLIEEG